jgi:hypothetical protein
VQHVILEGQFNSNFIPTHWDHRKIIIGKFFGVKSLLCRKKTMMMNLTLVACVNLCDVIVLVCHCDVIVDGTGVVMVVVFGSCDVIVAAGRITQFLQT